MAPKTRPRTSTPATAPVSRTYRSTRPPQQVQFPARAKKIKTYGRSSAARTARQQTLTQLNYVIPTQEDDDNMDDVLVDDSPQRGQKRRRTMGDSPTSSFHTQTLTQFMSVKGEDSDEDKKWLKIKDSEDEEDEFGGFDSDDEKVIQDSMKEESEVKAESREISMVPQTPAGKRIKTEIPSSQPSPFTPMLGKYIPGGDMRSPLKEKSTNVGAPLSSEKILAKTPRTLVIEDSFCTVPSTTHSEDSPRPAHRSPLKELRSPQVRARMSLELGASDANERRAVRDEIPDSDDDFGSLGPTPQKMQGIDDIPDPGTPTPRPRGRIASQLPKRQTPVAEEPVPDEESAEIDLEATVLDLRTSSPSPLAKKQHEIATSSTVIEKETSPSSPPSAASPSPKIPSERTPTKRTPAKRNPAKRSPVKHTPAKSQFYSQALESQRVPLEILQSMAPVGDKSDIIISIQPQHVDNIVNGTKSHEFRNYMIPPSVDRFWIYITRPVCQLRYMAHVGNYQTPGQIDSNIGIGNAEFNTGSKSKYAYELKQVYELNNPVSLDVMRQNGWVDAPPHTFCYVPPAVAGQLLGNLRCALFDDNALPSSMNMSISQEVEAQLKSDIAHSTQHPSSEANYMVPSSQALPPPSRAPPSSGGKADMFARPSLPASKTRSSQRTPTIFPGRLDESTAPPPIRPSQATTASQPSSQVPSPEKSVPRPQILSSIPSFPEDLLDDGESPLQRDETAGPYFPGSSQLILPDSLYEEIREPPVVLDSEDEGDDE